MTTGKVVELTDSDYQASVAAAPLAVVDIHAAWCGPCRLFAPLFDEFAARYPQISFFKIDGDLNPAARDGLTITNLPFVVAFQGGKQVDTVSTTTEEGFDEFLKKFLAKARA